MMRRYLAVHFELLAAHIQALQTDTESAGILRNYIATHFASFLPHLRRENS
jgi:hypothetical protein